MTITLLTGAFTFGLTFLLGSVLFGRRVRSNAALLDAIIDGQLPGKARRRRATTPSSQRHSRSAILDPGTAERLVPHVMEPTAGDHATGEVLVDLIEENRCRT